MRFRTLYLAALLTGAIVMPVEAGVIYDSIPTVLPANVPSLGYQATSTSEFGGLVSFATSYRDLTDVTLLMSDWAVASEQHSLDPTWQHAITLNLYSVNTSGAIPTPGALIATRTATFDIPWRPESSGGCTGGWLASDGLCHGGIAFTVTFDFSGTTVPDQLIYGVAFNTNNWGYVPIGKTGPYESLNFGLSTSNPIVGSNPQPDLAYWNTAYAGFYSDGGAGGTSTFRADTNWAPYSGGIEFEATAPEPGASWLLVAGLAALVWRKHHLHQV